MMELTKEDLDKMLKDVEFQEKQTAMNQLVSKAIRKTLEKELEKFAK